MKVCLPRWFHPYFLLTYDGSDCVRPKDVMQGKLFQKCTHLLYCSVLSLVGNVNTRRMSKPDIRSIFYIKKSMKYRKLLCEFSKLSIFNAFNLLGY